MAKVVLEVRRLAGKEAETVVLAAKVALVEEDYVEEPGGLEVAEKVAPVPPEVVEALTEVADADLELG